MRRKCVVCADHPANPAHTKADGTAFCDRCAKVVECIRASRQVTVTKRGALKFKPPARRIVRARTQ